MIQSVQWDRSFFSVEAIQPMCDSHTFAFKRTASRCPAGLSDKIFVLCTAAVPAGQPYCPFLNTAMRYWQQSHTVGS